MIIGKTILLFAVIAFSAAGGFLIGRQNEVSVSAQKKSGQTTKNVDLINKIKKEKIKEIKTWGNDETEFYGVIREVDEPPEAGSIFKTAEKLSIYDESGKTVYEHKDFQLGELETARFVRSDSSEIMFSTNGGGTDDFLKILSYKNGKFTEIIDDSDTQYRGGYFSMLQYRTGNKAAYFNPSQLIVIRQIGGADENPSASVFRTMDNKFQKVGEIKMRELGDFIENQIVRNKTAK